LASGIPARLSAAEGRKFGFTVGGAFLVLALLLWWRGKAFPVRMVFASLGALLGLAALVAPTALGPVNKAWMGLAHLISKVTTPIFLGIVYYLVLTPIGLLRRATGHHSMVHQAGPTGYWLAREVELRSRVDMERQF
jgi:Saxitoxin biosynthesis operon protein SxtJ